MASKEDVWDAIKNPKWAVDFQWSQTERGCATITARTSEEAQLKVKEKLPGIHHTTGASKITHDLSD